MSEDLIRLPAREVVARLRAGSLDPEELVEASLARIDSLDATLNAVPTRLPERSRAACVALRQRRAEAIADPFWLGGLPIVIKDTHPVAGVRTTYGSTVFADHVPTSSAWHVELLERRGAIIVGKSNTPEFAAGAQTFNDVFGVTRNPWNPALTCGGSSGGSAVAVATGMAWFGDGSDLGGSLRLPAAFCGVVGLRPTAGRVPLGPQPLPFQTLSVVGPIARDTRDLALVLDAMSCADRRDPLGITPSERFSTVVERPSAVVRIGFDPDLGGRLPVDGGIAKVITEAIGRIASSGVEVETVGIAEDDSIEAFATLRAIHLAGELAPIAAGNPGRLKPELQNNIEVGLKLQGRVIADADRARGRLCARVAALHESMPILVMPTTILPPFDVSIRFPVEAGGRRFERYFDWAAPTFVISLTGCPALSIPCGLTPEGLPVGLQLIAPPREEGLLLAFARELEDLFQDTFRPWLASRVVA